MNISIEPRRSEWSSLCQRPSEGNQIVRERVDRIINMVREGGDEALKKIADEIDGFVPESFQLSEKEIEEASERVNPQLKKAISEAAANIRAFHKAQMPSVIEVETTPGVKCIQKPVPIEKVGLYIPGGTAPLFSTVLMLAIPAQIAGCTETILCSPAGKDGKIADSTVFAAAFCGVNKIFRIGGAQAVAAMAFGTGSVPKVDKIFGPGNQYVTTAKQILGGSVVSIDMPAGPSEVMVMMDETTNPAFAAADLLSQAEHGKDSQVVLVCGRVCEAESVKTEVERQLQSLGRAELASAALSCSSAVILTDRRDQIDFANEYAPEHLIISSANPWETANHITAAGSVFIGPFTPESAGDYASGTNHTLPTCGWARSCSGVNIDSFMRKMTIQEISSEGLKGLSDTIITMAEAEGLQAHANAVKVRING